MKYNIVICDQDCISLAIIKRYVELFCKQCNVVANIHCFSKADHTLNVFLHNNTVHIAFLDIDMDNTSGLDVAKELQIIHPKAILFFISSYNEYALAAFELLAFGYIKKPIDQVKFQLLFERALTLIGNMQYFTTDSFLEIVANKKCLKIRQSQIIYAEKIQQKTIIQTSIGRYEVYETISSIEKKLNDQFIRISQSVVVNRNEILVLERNCVYLSTGEEFIIGRTYIAKIKALYHTLST